MGVATASRHGCRLLVLATVSCCLWLLTGTVGALGSPEPRQSGAVGLEGKISSPPPTQAPTISSPNASQVFTGTPITVAGLCKTGLLVKVFANNVFGGATTCHGGSYSLKIDLFSGANELVARLYDSLDQAGPDSNLASVRFSDATYAETGTRVMLSSTYARRGSDPGSTLRWPIVLSGGKGPYAISTDWGDGTDASLQTQTTAGTFTIKHVYATAGIYRVIVKATGSDGTIAFLQLVGVGNGNATANDRTGGTASTTPSVVVQSGFFDRVGMWLVVSVFPLSLVAFWLGSRHELYTLRRRIERSRTHE